MSAEGVRLTKTQREFLELALRSQTGNPWPLVPIQRRKGGALHRMFTKMQADGLFDTRSNCITPAGRAALTAETGGRNEGS